MRRVIKFEFIIATIIIIASSCSSTKNAVYFNNVQDSKIKSDFVYVEPTIQINDILSIIVSSQSAEASAPFNAPNESTFITSSASSSANRLTIGYLVNQKGEIQFPILGIIQAAGLSKSQLTAYITQQLKDRQLLVDPITTIRHLNYKVSVLGEVARPGVISVPNEKINLLEALSFAGDITIYGKRDNVLLIRENDKGEKTIKRLDLTNPEILSSPYYYLEANDLLYVEPSHNRLAFEKSTQRYPIILSALSLIIIAITSFR